MKLLAISDLHLGYEANRSALSALKDYSSDCLILCGDLGETAEHLEFAFTTLGPKFARLLWVPGNHELWTSPHDQSTLRGEYKYKEMIEIARRHNVLTPEDPFSKMEFEGKAYYLAPVFTLYDYSYGPAGLSPAQAVEWAMEEDIYCADEVYLHPDPYPSRQAWCQALCDRAEAKLAALDPKIPIVLIDHFPLRRDLVTIPAIPRFSIWCGTKRTEEWHKRFNIEVAVSGHLHLRSTKWRDGVRFEEVSLGYPRQWSRTNDIDSYFCQVLPFKGRLGPHDQYFGLNGRSSP